MIYFVTEVLGINAIELSQIKRLELFSKMNLPAKIVETSLTHHLSDDPKVVNVLDFYLKRSFPPKENFDIALKEIFGNEKFQSYQVAKDMINYHSKSGIVVKTYQQSISQVDYYEYGKLSQSNVYDSNVISYQINYDHTGNPIKRIYFDYQGKKKLAFSPESVELYVDNKKIKFQTKLDFIAYFLSNLIKTNDTMIIDRLNSKIIDKLPSNLNIFRFVHSDLANSEKIKIQNLFNDYKIKSLICSTKLQQQLLQKQFKLANTQVYAIPVTYKSNSINKVPFSNRDKNRLICVARISREKRLEDTIDAFAIINSRYPKSYLEIYGYVNDQNYLGELKEQIRKLNLEEKVHFKGFVENLSPVYDDAVLQIVTSISEGLSMTLVEGQSHGLPAISYNIDFGPKEILDSELLTSENSHELANLAIKLLSNQNELKRISDEAYQNKKYSLNQVADKWKNFLAIKQLT